VTTYELPLPYGQRLPLTANKARSGTHHHVQNALKRGVHADVAALVAAHRVPPLPGADLTLTWQLPNRVRRDCTGMSWLMKAIEDGLVLAGTIPGDDWRYVRTTTMRVIPPMRGEAGVMTLTITEATR
jgi:hypothetical protein